MKGRTVCWNWSSNAGAETDFARADAEDAGTRAAQIPGMAATANMAEIARSFMLKHTLFHGALAKANGISYRMLSDAFEDFMGIDGVSRRILQKACAPVASNISNVNR
jgi:hypothetical protein